jgi:hypothetical protein
MPEKGISLHALLTNLKFPPYRNDRRGIPLLRLRRSGSRTPRTGRTTSTLKQTLPCFSSERLRPHDDTAGGVGPVHSLLCFACSARAGSLPRTIATAAAIKSALVHNRPRRIRHTIPKPPRPECFLPRHRTEA